MTQLQRDPIGSSDGRADAATTKERILSTAFEFLARSPLNRVGESETRWFDDPLLRFADARDPNFLECKRSVGSHHLTPQEAWDAQHGEGSFRSGTVIAIALPIAEPVRRTNARQREWPSREMVAFRNAQGAVVDGLLERLLAFVREEGRTGFVPARSQAFRAGPGPDGVPTSNWSERHVAFVSGMGSFSLNDAFITEKGIAVRMTSILTDLELPPSRGPRFGHGANCLGLSRGVCGACIRRCPAGALSAKGHDKIKCGEHLRREAGREYAASQGGDPALGAGCALCQSGVPCEAANPTRRRGEIVLDDA